MKSELRDRALADAWLAAGLCLGRIGRPTPEETARSSPWVAATCAERHALPPAGVIADIGRLCAGAALDLGAAPPDVPAPLRAAVRAYDDHVLSRIASDPRMDSIADAVAALPKAMVPEAVALVSSHVLDRIGFDAGTIVSAAAARRLAQRPASEVVTLGLGALRVHGPVTERLTQGYEAMTSGARRARWLLGDAEVFILEHLAVLRELTQRLAIEQVVEAAADVERLLPRRLKPRAPPQGSVATQVEDEAQFPAGGFSSLSTSGSLENLVISELVYMEDERNLDLFDVRYVEGELLYYTRDESVHVRRRRVVVLALAPDLARARFKDPGAKWQRIVRVLGLVVCLVRRLAKWLSEQALTIRLVFVRDERDRTPLSAERALLEILLDEWRERGIVEVAEAASVDEVGAWASTQARAAQVDLLVVGATAAEPLKLKDARVRTGAVGIEGAAPTIRWRTTRRPVTKDQDDADAAPPSSMAATTDTESAWSEAALDLLEELV